MKIIENIKALLIDLEGVLYSDNQLIPGSIDVIKELKKEGIKLRFLTNTTTSPRKTILDKLISFGFNIEEKEIFTPIIATKNYLRDNSLKKIALITNIEIIEEFKEYEITQKNPEAVIMGDIYKNFNWEILDRIFKLVYLNNAGLIALHQNKYCMRDGKVSLDLGPFVKAIEYASNKKSILMGKPEKIFLIWQSKIWGLIKISFL
jgi:Predicted sugar phosphatases of the HAD superfamily